MNVHITTHQAMAPPQRRHSARGGFLYVAVLMISLIVMASVAAALTISTASLRGESARADRLESLQLAESEIHRLAALMSESADWRTDTNNNQFSNWRSVKVDNAAMDNLQVRHRLVDSDGDLADDPTDPVELTVHAKVGRSQAAVSVQLESAPVPLDLLNYSVTSERSLKFDKNAGGVLSCERPVQVGHNCDGAYHGILTTPRLECDGNIQITLRGDRTSDSITLPSEDVLDYYVDRGTEIRTDAIDAAIGHEAQGGDLVLRDQLLSANDNPFGNTNPDGIYWIDCHHRKVKIFHCRFHATVVFVNANKVEIEDSVLWSYPTTPDVMIAADSEIKFKNIRTPLHERNRNKNFNPSSTPFRETLSDSSQDDEYPLELRGIIYSTGNVKFEHTDNERISLAGLVVCREFRIDDARLSITHLDELLSNPPRPFVDPTPMRFVRGTFRRVPAQ